MESVSSGILVRVVTTEPQQEVHYLLFKLFSLSVDHFYFNVFNFFFHFIAAPASYRSSWARGQIGAAGASLHHSHSNTGSELNLQTMLQLTATPDP